MGTAASAYLVLRAGRLVGIGLPAEVARAYLRPELLAGVKFNEHHDERGRFASGGSGGGAPSDSPKVFTDEREANVWTRYNFQKWEDSLSLEELDTLDEYGSSACYPWNQHLRGQPNDRGERISKQHTARMDKMIERGTIPESVILHRGVSDSNAEFFWKAAKEGATFTDHGYVSTTPSRDLSGQFVIGRDGRSRGFMINIVVPKGTHAGSILTGPEIILGRGHKFKINLKIGSEENRDREMLLELVE